MGRHQPWLVLLLVALCCATLIETLNPNAISDDDSRNNQIETAAKKLPGKKYKIGVIPDGHSTKIPLAEDPRFNKMLPATNVLKDESKKKEDEENDYYNYDYEDDYNYDESSTESNKTVKIDEIEKPKPVEKLKPIKGDDKAPPKPSKDDKSATTTDDLEDDDDDDDEYDDAINDEEEIVFNENVPCPRDCICARNINSYLVATCSRLDADVQKFGSDITDLIVVDVGPKYPILLGPNFFIQIGLKYVSSIKITNCTIEYIDPTAFHGLEELYAVNLTNAGLTTINPDTFVENKKLRMLTIAGNDLSTMAHGQYLIKSSSVEELDLSHNNLHELNNTAFSRLSNIVYINLASNNLRKLPEPLFDAVETIEELDLSFNSLSTLPRNLFNRTALAILHLKYNDISNDLHFGNADLQHLDLSFNVIKQIHHGMFDKMEGLTNLNLKGNGITKIQPDSFLPLKNLRHIDLSINDLDQVSSLLFYKNTELDVIKMSDNPRLSQLPTDGFQSVSGDFTVYLFDVSNCAIGALGHKTFSTMPHLVTLRLAWNNINNLDKGTFVDLSKLVELDLSNNLINKLDDQLFTHNREMSKLNLAGNPIRKLSVKLFFPLDKLKDLDVSECELHTLLTDNAGVEGKFKFFDTLRSFNASYNQIKRIGREEVQYFKNLKTLDITSNPLKCNEDFKGLIKFLTKKNIATGKVETLAALDDSFGTGSQTTSSWDEIATVMCKHTAEVFKPKEKTIEEIKKEILKEDKLDIPKLVASKEETKNKDIAIEKKIKEDLEEDTSLGDEDEEEDEDDDDSYSDYDENDKEDANNEFDLGETKPAAKDKGLFAEEVNIIKETRDKFLLGKLADDDDDDDNGEDDDDDDADEIIIERGRIYYSGYRFLIPMIVVITSVMIILIAIGKIVSLMVRKRGERYKMALLASKNSIVYQKLSEDIPAPKQPKLHKYAPIDQV